MESGTFVGFYPVNCVIIGGGVRALMGNEGAEKEEEHLFFSSSSLSCPFSQRNE